MAIPRKQMAREEKGVRVKESERAQIKRRMTKARESREEKNGTRQSERQRAPYRDRVDTKRKEEKKKGKGKERKGKTEHRSRWGRKSERGLAVWYSRIRCESIGAWVRSWCVLYV